MRRVPSEVVPPFILGGVTRAASLSLRWSLNGEQPQLRSIPVGGPVHGLRLGWGRPYLHEVILERLNGVPVDIGVPASHVHAHPIVSRPTRRQSGKGVGDAAPEH